MCTHALECVCVRGKSKERGSVREMNMQHRCQTNLGQFRKKGIIPKPTLCVFASVRAHTCDAMKFMKNQFECVSFFIGHQDFNHFPTILS